MPAARRSIRLTGALPGQNPELPPNFHFMDAKCHPSLEERPEFQAVRCAFGVDAGFQAAASQLLAKVLTDGERSTAKSGSVMAFKGAFMVKSMNSWEAWTLSSILKDYLVHLQLPENRSNDGTVPGTLLPRFFGAYVQVTGLDPAGLVTARTCYMIVANVFADVPPEVRENMEIFDLKGSADDRSQRRVGSEFMDFDLLQKDRKLVPERGGAFMLEQLERDLAFLLRQRMPGDVNVPEAIRGSPGLMDYSLLVGLVPRGTPGGIYRLDVCDTTIRGSPVLLPEFWRVEVERKTALIGVIDVLQFWTPAKRIARQLKKAVGMEHDDDWEYHGEILDTLQPAPYKRRFLRFMQEVFLAGSWMDSLLRLADGDWDQVLEKHILLLPFEQQREADTRRLQQNCKRTGISM